MAIPLHIVLIGPGALGLGLVGSVAAEAGVGMTLVGRHGPQTGVVKRALSRHNQYIVRSEVDEQTVGSYELYWSDVAKSRSQLVEKLSDLEADILLCTSLASGQSVAVDLVREIVAGRDATKVQGVVVLAPCENTVAPILSDLAVSLVGQRNFVYADCMVDRFCKSPLVGKHGIVEVSVASEYEWAISIRNGKRVKQADQRRLRSNIERLNVTILNSVDNTKERKTLLCNGVHFCAALLAGSLGHNSLLTYFETENGVKALQSLTYEFARVWQYRHQEESDQRVHGLREWYYGRLVKNDHDVDTVLRNLTAKHPANFSRDILNKITIAFQDLLAFSRTEAKKSMMLQALKLAHEQQLHMLTDIED